jgi:predicted aspartyl protease
MASVLGYRDESGHPRIKVLIRGLGPGARDIELDCLIDTGFTGCILLPHALAILAQLTFDGTTNIGVSYANGNEETCLLARAIISLGGKSEQDLVVVAADSPQVLVGMGFFKTFRMALYIRGDQIVLFDEDDLDEAV